ncbi:SDR family NAD(P)-dependent oxidoreductase [Embleya sp. NBC_00896]|uniref:SDR family NAD(P)-dependent oxidoreductase n=1 Tax=Embleya sp. NBC_00896 TaxID=2975961 RepID=UPI0038689EEF|nr:SDR family NAD(P)-dependent oxidoreductase [Embleya sp. NBC_00896]
MIRDFSGRVCVVTGAGSGIGRALAYELAAHGARLALADIDAKGLRETADRAERLGAREIHTELVDVADRAAVLSWADETAERFGGVDLVVNNAGVALTATVEEMGWDDFEWLMGVNFWGVAYGTKAFLPHLRRSRAGHLVNISSVFGLFGVPSQSAYCAAKYAVRGFTESVRQEMRLSGSGVGVTTVHPGGVKTNIVRNSRTAPAHDKNEVVALHDAASRTSAQRAARIILRGVQRGRARVFVGADATAIDLGSRLLGTVFEPLVRAVSKRTGATTLGPVATPMPAPRPVPASADGSALDTRLVPDGYSDPVTGG